MSGPPKKKQKTAFKEAVVTASMTLFDHLVPTLTTIVTQSLKINEHHHYIEAKLVFENSCSYASVRSGDVGKFLRNKMCQWEFKDGGSHFLDFGFSMQKNKAIADSINNMHGTLKDLCKHMKTMEMHDQSLLFEIKGARNYVGRTWQQIDVVAHSFSLILVLFEDIAALDTTCHHTENEVLSFTHSVMTIVGRYRAAHIRFLHKICLCIGSDDYAAILKTDQVNHKHAKMWQKRDDQGPSYFINSIERWAERILGTGLEYQMIGMAIDTSLRYLENCHKNTIMSRFT